MIDIDEEIDDEWLNPKPGWKLDEADDMEDAVAFGKDIIARLMRSIGEEVMLPLLEILIVNTIENDSDWRFKNAGFLAFSAIGEFLEKVDSVEPMIPHMISNFKHQNPKIRYAAQHCVGTLCYDLKN